MTTPLGNLFFGGVFRLKVTIEGSFTPSAMQLSPTPKWLFSRSFVLIRTILSPFWFNVLLLGMSKRIGASTILPILLRGKSSVFCLFITKCRKSITFSSNSDDSFWAILVLCLSDIAFFLKNLVHQPWEAVKVEMPWYFPYLAICNACKRTAYLDTLQSFCL